MIAGQLAIVFDSTVQSAPAIQQLSQAPVGVSMFVEPRRSYRAAHRRDSEGGRTAMRSATGPGTRRSIGATRAAVAAVLVASPVLGACGLVDDDPPFAEGDCVGVGQGTLDSDLKEADCQGAVGTFDPAERIYRVNSIIDNTDGGCPSLQGFFPVEFVHEPDGVTYCLVQED